MQNVYELNEDEQTAENKEEKEGKKESTMSRKSHERGTFGH